MTEINWENLNKVNLLKTELLTLKQAQIESFDELRQKQIEFSEDEIAIFKNSHSKLTMTKRFNG